MMSFQAERHGSHKKYAYNGYQINVENREKKTLLMRQTFFYRNLLWCNLRALSKLCSFDCVIWSKKKKLLLRWLAIFFNIINFFTTVMITRDRWFSRGFTRRPCSQENKKWSDHWKRYHEANTIQVITWRSINIEFIIFKVENECMIYHGYTRTFFHTSS